MTYGRPGVYINERVLSTPITREGSPNAAGAVIGAFASGPTSVTLVSSWYDFVTQFGGYNQSFPATFGVGQFFQNGGGDLYVRRVTSSSAAVATALITRADLTAGTVATVTSKNVGSDSNNLRVQLTATGAANYYNLTVTKESGVADTIVSGVVTANYSDDTVLEVFRNVRFDDTLSSDYVETVVGYSSKYINIVVANNTNPPTEVLLPLSGGANGTAPVKTDYSTAVMAEFGVIDRPLVMFAPEIVSQLTAADAVDVHKNMLTWANTGNGFAVIDTAKDLTVTNAIAYATSLTPTSSQGAVYYPNIFITDPIGRSSAALRKIGPAGAVVGLYMATDKIAGPFKAPAGIGASINTTNGVIATEKTFTAAELDTLNSAVKPVNAIRNIPGAGIVVMGARTLLQDGTANRYINMRRSLIYIKKNLQDSTTFALFENNDERLWANIRNTITVFLNQYRNQGGLRGANPSSAFYVKCDAENNTAQTIANGEVHIEVGVALEYPAEFVVINLTQTAAL